MGTDRDEGEYIDNAIRARAKTLALFAPGKQNTFARERWVAMTLAADLGHPGSEDKFREIERDVTVDVAYEDARFQVKEIMAHGRRRTDEIKASLNKAKTAVRAVELLKPFELGDITPIEIGAMLDSKMCDYIAKYPVDSDRAMLDLLVYVNLESLTDDEPMPNLQSIADAGWRSVSVVTNDGSLVFYARDDAPSFIRQAVQNGKRKRSMDIPPGNTHAQFKFAHDKTSAMKIGTRTVLSRSVAALYKTLDVLELKWSVGYSPQNDDADEPEITVVWGLIDPAAAEATLGTFEKKLHLELEANALRLISSGSTMP